MSTGPSRSQPRRPANPPPSSSTQSISTSTATTAATTSSHRRRHSLPPANKLASILSFWSNSNASDDPLRLAGERLSRPRSTSQKQTSASSVSSRRRNRRNSKSKYSSSSPPPPPPPLPAHPTPPLPAPPSTTSSATVAKPVVTQPVLVRAYSPRPESTVTTTIPEVDESERVPLPAITEFSFTGILKAIDPKVTRTIETITHLSTTYRSNLTHETDLLITHQKSIESQILLAERLSTQVLKTTTTRSDRLKSEAPFKNGLAVEDLAQSAETAYSTIENIIATLEAIDEMLPEEEKLGKWDSVHKRHFPYTHSLLVAKTADTTVKRLGGNGMQMGSSVAVPSPLSPRMTSSNSFSNNHALMGDTATNSGGSWLIRRRREGSNAGLPSNLPYLSPNGPPMTAEERRLSSPPALLLRTVHPGAASIRSSSAKDVAVPQVASPSPYHIRRQSLVTNIPVRERDSLSVASNAGGSTRSSFSFKNLLWGGGWKKGAGSGKSVGGSSVAGSENGETAEEKLRRIIQEQTRKRLMLDKKGAGLSSSLPM
ncbi:hypothetical protein TWF106_005449 [Orbilia oligospora]|uniref:BLOC-1-related complex subunit 5 n=1 Tax=Orbilia oligospora TaxID=2813651 RepID=A0A7C8QRD9_ORBOL|nr:hypothetical protein TWF679_000616 [Orbilia oligospora]KAF3220166.1 hypothetical protein TWF191_007483 [Orbilia oligospora]KAF3222643.1 hypothetical protein TWF106_005449 [Orbilia oligospora]